MAGRFVLQKFASGVSRSTSLLSAHASASARATTPVIPGASGAGIRTLSNVFLRAAAHPGMAVPGSHVLHGCGARYLNTFSSSHEAAKTGWWARVQSNLELNPLPHMFLLFALVVVCCVPTPSEYKRNRSKVPVLQCSGCCNCIGSRSKS